MASFVIRNGEYDWQKLLKLNMMKSAGLSPEPGDCKHNASITKADDVFRDRQLPCPLSEPTLQLSSLLMWPFD
jgi:hypothetical protein